MAKIPDWQIDDKGTTGTDTFGTELKYYPGKGFVREVAGSGGRSGRIFHEIMEAGATGPITSLWWQSLYAGTYTQNQKILIPGTENEIGIATKKVNDNGYVRHILQRQNFIATNSLGTTSEVWRRTTVRDIHDAIIGRSANSFSAESGVWTLYTMNANDYGLSPSPSNINPPLSSYWADALGEYRDYPVIPDANGNVRVTLLGTSTSTQFAELAVAGGATISTVDTRRTGAVNELRHFTIAAPGGLPFTLRIRHGSGDTGRLYIIGVNTHLLSHNENAISGVSYDFSGSWEKETTRRYMTSSGAQDYAMTESTTNLWGGSTHGGETVSSQVIKVDDVACLHTQHRMGKTISIDRTSLIDWGNGKQANVLGRIWFEYDGVASQRFKINVGATTFKNTHFGMTTSALPFDQVDLPTLTDTSVAADYPFGTNSVIAQQNPDTGQFIVSICNSHQKIKSGDHLSLVRNDGSNYCKVYFEVNDTASDPFSPEPVTWETHTIFG